MVRILVAGMTDPTRQAFLHISGTAAAWLVGLLGIIAASCRGSVQTEDMEGREVGVN